MTNKIEEIALTPLPDLPAGIVKHAKFGELFDRLQVHQYAVKYAEQQSKSLLAELSKDAEPVAEVCDNGTPEGGTKWLVRLSHKLLKDGDKLYTHPTPVSASEQKPVAWVDVIDRHEGPYNFNGLELLDSGKHLLFTSPPNTADIEQRVAEACAKMIQGWSCTNGPSIAEAIRSGKWREYL